SSFENDTITNKDVFEKSLKETVIGEVHVSEKTKQKIINISSPITLNEEFVGVLVISYDFEKINQVSDNKFELGETGETYLVNKDGYVITSLRFKEDAFLKQKIDSVNLKNCLKHAGNTHLNHKEVISFIDYQGVKVLGAHSYIPETQWCLLAEKDDREIMASINHDIKKTWMFIFAIVGLITVVGMLFNFLLTRSLKKEVDAKTINIKNQSNKIKEQLKKEELITKEKDRLLVGQKKAQIKLEEQIKEMEKFQKLTVNRELRMIELKKEIKKLESK
ncbi:MAG: cache domain-containing protein, partial [Patescibacteria group bacterium]|nr:cache domain-containing protein [Patescibacteria group bacterium]